MFCKQTFCHLCHRHTHLRTLKCRFVWHLWKLRFKMQAKVFICVSHTILAEMNSWIMIQFSNDFHNVWLFFKVILCQFGIAGISKIQLTTNICSVQVSRKDAHSLTYFVKEYHPCTATKSPALKWYQCDMWPILLTFYACKLQL